MREPWLTSIKDEIAFNNGYINWEDFYKEVVKGNRVVTEQEFDRVIATVAVEYGKNVERHFECKEPDSNIEELEETILNLEHEVNRLEGILFDKGLKHLI